MCGIAGIVDYSSGQLNLRDACLRMTNALIHRGPDGYGVWAEGPVALGHRRLSVIDLSETGTQPMRSACGRWTLAFNGEIYNFQSLRGEVAALPEFSARIGSWRGHSDTEVLLAAVTLLGVEAAVKRCIGMFACAAWDRDSSCLYLGRDRMGEKPLYYGRLGSAFVFASELKALRCHPLWQGGVDRDVLALYMRHSYVPSPNTIHPGIFKLPPASILKLRAGTEPDIKPYWSFREAAEAGLADPWRESEAAAATELERLLSASVASQMLADVPLGAFLSGGIDSATVVSLMQASSSQPVRTFSIGFAESGFNEAPYARAIAAHLGTEHCELYVSASEARAVIPDLPLVYDEPFADPSQIPTLVLSRLVRQKVTVALSGDGGDELFGGYERYPYALALHRQRTRLPRMLRSTLSRGIAAVPPDVWSGLASMARPLMPRRLRNITNVGEKAHKLAALLLDDDPIQLYRNLLSHWREPLEVVLGASERATAFDQVDEFLQKHGMFNTMLYLDSISYLPDDILVKVDRAAMAASLETRVPFLDHRLIEFAWRLPTTMKLSSQGGKRILRQVLARHVPAHLFERPKMGFGVPLGQWLRGPLRDWAETLLAEDRLRRGGYFNVSAVRKKWDEHMEGQADWQYLLWDVLMFEAWLERQ